jgi:DNA-binding CsgD family transcriptional regulator
LREAARDVAGGWSVTVVVHGSPGTGRSALLGEAAALARDAGLAVVELSCRPADRDRRHGIARDALAAVGHARASGPLAVIVDDAQWADPHSIRRARALVSRLGRPLLLVVAGYDGAVLGPGLLPRRTLGLTPLPDDAVRTLLARAYGDDLDPALLPAAVQATRGNPALLCAAIRRRPAPAPDPDDLRAAVDQVWRVKVRQVLDALPGHLVPLLRACSVGAGGFTFAQAYELAGGDGPARERARADLARTGLVDGTERPRIRDPLLADGILAVVDGASRRDLLDRAAVLARRDGAPAAVLGRLLLSARLAEPWVAPVLVEAGLGAARAGDYPGAVAYLESALGRAPAQSPRAEILLALANAQLHIAPKAAERTLQRIVTDSGAPDLAVLAADLLALRGGGQSVRVLADAAREHGTATVAGQALHGLHALAATGAVTPVLDDPDADKCPATLAATAWRYCLSGRRRDQAQHLAATALALDDDSGLLTPRLVAARVLAVAEDVDAASDALVGTEEAARRRDVPPALGLALLAGADLALRRGQVDRARERLDAARAALPPHRWHPRPRARLVALTVLVELEAGRVSAAEGALAAAGPFQYRSDLDGVELLFARGVLDSQAGRADAARARLRECGRLLLGIGCRNPALVPWRSHLALAGAADSAQLLADELAAAREWGAAGPIGAVELYSGLAVPAPESAGRLRAAVRTLAGSPVRSRYARALIELAAALLNEGESVSANRMLAEAAEVLRSCGIAGMPRVDEVAQRHGAVVRAAEARLSPAQLRVARLAADGLPNKAIAEALSITRRAVELHLTNTYRALGIAGRPDLAAALGRDDSAVS